MKRKVTISLYALGVLLLCHHFILRPLILDWGAPESLKTEELPGDWVADGEHHTRAVLIDAPADSVWMWVIQLGQERGGFYSYTWLENAFFADMKNVYELRSELQSPRYAGDTIWLASEERFKKMGYQILAQVNTAESFVMVSGEDYARVLKKEPAIGSWAIYLKPASHTKTWLIARSTGGHANFWQQLMRYTFYEVPHFIMERKMLLRIKELSELT